MPIIKKSWVNKLRPCSTNFEEVSIWSPWNLISILTLYNLQSKVEWWRSWYGRHVNITVSQLNADDTVAWVVLLLKLMVCNKRVSLIRIIAYQSSWYCLLTLKSPQKKAKHSEKFANYQLTQKSSYYHHKCSKSLVRYQYHYYTSITLGKEHDSLVITRKS